MRKYRIILSIGILLLLALRANAWMLGAWLSETNTDDYQAASVIYANDPAEDGMLLMDGTNFSSAGGWFVDALVYVYSNPVRDRIDENMNGTDPYPKEVY